MRLSEEANREALAYGHTLVRCFESSFALCLYYPSLRTTSKKELTFYALECIFARLDMLDLKANAGVLREEGQVSSSFIRDVLKLSLFRFRGFLPLPMPSLFRLFLGSVTQRLSASGCLEMGTFIIGRVYDCGVVIKVNENERFYELPSFLQRLFEDKVELLPSVNELFELELAYLEYNCLPKSDLLDRSAYFKSINGEFTKHFLMYNQSRKSLTDNRSVRTKAYFGNGLFSTGYATHGLFPYRGKFHPQLIKALINIIGIKKGETILDPMCGSGTANIETALMGINSYAIDLSPFCQFMTKVKYNSLSIHIELLKGISNKSEQLFNFFNVNDIRTQLQKITDHRKLKVYELALLAFLDSLGYSKRVIKSTHRQLFTKVLKRYEDTVANFILNSSRYIDHLGTVNLLREATALNILLEDNSVDGVITSPPYSFAIDYVKNDEAQLNFLGYDVNNIRNEMIGLIGKNKNERLENYFRDMGSVCSEVSRVLKEDRYFVMIIGSNTNQTGGIRLESKIIESCKKHNLTLVKSILKPIKGMRNTMKDEYILFFQKRCGK